MNPRPPACKAGALTAELTSLAKDADSTEGGPGCQHGPDRRTDSGQCATYPSSFSSFRSSSDSSCGRAAAADAGEALLRISLDSSVTLAGLGWRPGSPSPPGPSRGRTAPRGRSGSGPAARRGCRPGRCRPGCRPASSPARTTVRIFVEPYSEKAGLPRAALAGPLEIGHQRAAVLLRRASATRAGRAASAGTSISSTVCGTRAPGGIRPGRRDPQRHVQGRLVDRAGVVEIAVVLGRAPRRGRR